MTDGQQDLTKENMPEMRIVPDEELNDVQLGKAKIVLTKTTEATVKAIDIKCGVAEKIKDSTDLRVGHLFAITMELKTPIGDLKEIYTNYRFNIYEDLVHKTRVCGWGKETDARRLRDLVADATGKDRNKMTPLDLKRDLVGKNVLIISEERNNPSSANNSKTNKYVIKAVLA